MPTQNMATIVVHRQIGFLCLQGSLNDTAASEVQRVAQRLSESEAAGGRARQPLEDGSSSFAALFGGASQPPPFGASLARRDSQSSYVSSSRLDDLGLNLDLPGLQVRHWSSCILVSGFQYSPGSSLSVHQGWVIELNTAGSCNQGTDSFVILS